MDSWITVIDGLTRRSQSSSTLVTIPANSYYLTSGSVSVVIEDDDGHEIILAYLNAGDFFGEIGMFDEKQERSAWVRARPSVRLPRLDTTACGLLHPIFPRCCLPCCRSWL